MACKKKHTRKSEIHKTESWLYSFLCSDFVKKRETKQKRTLVHRLQRELVLVEFYLIMNRRAFFFLLAFVTFVSSIHAQRISPAASSHAGSESSRRVVLSSGSSSSSYDLVSATSTTTTTTSTDTASTASKYIDMAARRHVHSPHSRAHSSSSSSTDLHLQKAKLLVVVLAGGNRNVYHAQRAFWRMIRPRVAHLGVEIYLTGKSMEVSKPTVSASGDTIVFPGQDNYYPAPLEATIQCTEYVFKNKLRGHDADYFLRTNMSTFWAFINLLSWIEAKPRQRFAAAVPYQLEIRYPAGTGILMSMDVVHSLLQKQKTLRYELVDDVAFGHFFISEGIHFEAMGRNNNLSANHTVIPFEHDLSELNWRVKNEAFEGDRIIFQDEKQDIAMWASLFLFWYGPSMVLL